MQPEIRSRKPKGDRHYNGKKEKKKKKGKRRDNEIQNITQKTKHRET